MRAMDERVNTGLLALGDKSSLRRGSLARNAMETPTQPRRPATTPPRTPTTIVDESKASE
jgi:hypothetical protein